MPARRDLGAGLSGCAVHRFLFCVRPPGLAFEGAYLVVVAEGTRADRAVVGTQEEVAGTAQAAVDPAVGTADRAAVEAAVGCGAVAVRRHLLSVSQACDQVRSALRDLP
jgi:hypothetical protein